MKKLVRLLVALVIAMPIIFSGCCREKLPPDVEKQVEQSVKNWNDIYGTNVTATGWKYKCTIKTEKKRKEIVETITDPDKAWFPSGDISAPGDMTARQIGDDPSISTMAITAWQDMVDSLVKVGQHIIEVSWTRGAVSYKSLCVADMDGIVYDNMFSNTVGGADATVCLNYKMWWIWEAHLPQAQWTRGYIKAELTANCNNGMPVTCDKGCTSSMTAGEAKISCKTSIVENCCQMEFTWAWACGFKSIKVKADGYSLEIEGIIGSSGAGDGSCTECCEEIQN